MSAYNNPSFSPRPSQAEMPVDQVDIARRIAELQSAAFGGISTQQKEELNGYYRHHEEYLTATAKEVEAATTSRPDIQVLTTEDPVTFTIAANGYDRLGEPTAKIEAPGFDAEILGLPQVPKKDAASDVLGLALAKDQAGSVTSVAAITRSPRGRVTVQYLQNIAAAENPSTAEEPQWVEPGMVLLPTDIDVQHTTDMNPKKGKGIDALSFKPAEGQTVTFIRTGATGAEQLATPKAEVHERRGKRIRRVGAVVGMIGVAGGIAGTIVHPKTENDRPVTSAQKLIQPLNTTAYEGVPQAVSSFDALDNLDFTNDTLERARLAFSEYFAGDQAGLKKQADALGYKDDWITTEKLNAVQNATTMNELETAVESSLAGTSIKFTIGDSTEHLTSLANYSDFDETPLTNFKDAQATSLDVLNVLNTFDPANLKDQVGPVNFVVVNTIQGKGDQHIAGSTIDGYCADDGQNRAIVIAGEPGRTHNDSDIVTTIGHELTHAQDQKADGALSQVVESLNPADFKYQNSSSSDVNGTDWKASTFDKGDKITDDAYGNTNRQEDMATVGQNLDVPNPVIDTNESPFQQKELEIMLSEEQEQPGFIANLLSRARSAALPGVLNRVDQLWNSSRTPLGAFGIATLVGVAGLWGRSRQTAKQRRIYAIPSPKK